MMRPFLPLAAALIAGITCGSHGSIGDVPAQISLLIVLILMLLFQRSALFRQHALFPFLLVALFFFGILLIHSRLHPATGDNHILKYADSKSHCIEGVISENPQVSPEKTELVISVARIVKEGGENPVSGRVLLNVRGSCPFRYGDYIRFQTRLKVPRNFQNPGAFDYERQLRFRGILIRGFIPDAAEMVLIRRDRGNPLRSRLEHFREQIRRTILEEAPGTEGKIIQAMILGDQRGIPREVLEKFNQTGTTHIIAISGFNIGIVAAFAFLLARLCLKAESILLRWDVTRLSIYVALAVVLLYTFIAGAGISVVRASIMVAVFLGAMLFQREGDLYNALFLAAFLILLFAPYSLFDISFQLSFTAVASLIFWMPKWLALLPPRKEVTAAAMTGSWGKEAGLRGLRGTALFCLASLSATLGTLPLILLYFNRFSLVTLFANLLCVPILGILAIPVSLAILLAVPLSAELAGIVINLAEILVQISLFLIDRLSALPWASVYMTTPTLPEIAAFYLLLIWGGLLLQWFVTRPTARIRPKMALMLKTLPVLLLLFFIADAIYVTDKALQPGRLRLTAIDVGQGNSTLIRFPGGERMVVDGGGFYDDSFDLGKLVVAPYLWHERISRIDWLVLTHPHPDHLQGLLFLLQNFAVREVWTNGDSTDTEMYRSFVRIIGDNGIPLRTLSAKTPATTISGVEIRFLNPENEAGRREIAVSTPIRTVGDDPMERNALPASAALPSQLANDISLVLQLSFGQVRFLLPADISAGVENRLLASGAELASDVLLVPHHGSRGSSTSPFLEKVSPKIALISCGADNIFGFPHPDLLRRYEKVQARVYRTDTEGAITVSTDGHRFSVETFHRRVPPPTHVNVENDDGNGRSMRHAR